MHISARVKKDIQVLLMLRLLAVLSFSGQILERYFRSHFASSPSVSDTSSNEFHLRRERLRTDP